VCRFKLGGFVLVPHSTWRCLGTLARFFAVPVWTSTFSNVSALVVPLSSTVLPSRDSFPSHPWFALRCNTSCDRLVAVTRAPTFEIEDALRCGVRSIDSARGRSPARYWASNARKAAVTVVPIPTIPSSTLGPSSAIHSSPRTNNLGRRTADGLPG
jgi:hypothetical protein